MTQRAGVQTLGYDRLVFALGSELVRPPIPGLAEYGFDIDTYDAAARLAAHLDGLPGRPASPGRFTALVVGGGLTGVEAATELRRGCGRSPAARPAGSFLPTGRRGSARTWATAPAPSSRRRSPRLRSKPGRE